MKLIALDPANPADPAHLAAIGDLWNAALPWDLAITPAGVAYNVGPATGVTRWGLLAVADDRPAGMILASDFVQGDPGASLPDVGWIEAVAVHPDRQGRGLGTDLLARARARLTERGCVRWRLGAGMRPFAPGLPSGLPSEDFFRGRGFQNRPPGKIDWDLARDLRTYVSPAGVRDDLAAAIRPARPEDEAGLLAFFQRVFPGRWTYEFQEHGRAGGRLSDYLILADGERVEGFCQTTWADSLRPLDRFFMHRLPRPWAQVGPIGVSPERRGGSGYGSALLDAALRRLRDAGMAGCVIDWTSLVDYYARFGFAPYRRYEMLAQEAAP